MICQKLKPEAEVLIAGGAFLVNTLTPRAPKTFQEYACKDMIPKVYQDCTAHKRTEMVFDVYRKTSLKAEARSKWGKSTRRRVTAKNKTPNKWQGFIRDSSNLRLFHFLADELAKMITVNEVFVTKGKDVLTNSSHIDADMNGLAPCTHEEADAYMNCKSPKLNTNPF